MSNARSVPQPTLFHTNFDAFSEALRAVAPDLLQQAADYHTAAQARGIPFNEDECLGRAVKVLVSMVEAETDEIEPPYDLDAIPDYNDDELLHCGIDR